MNSLVYVVRLVDCGFDFRICVFDGFCLLVSLFADWIGLCLMVLFALI